MFDTIKKGFKAVSNWVLGKDGAPEQRSLPPLPVLPKYEQPQPERNLGGKNYLHISREAPTIVTVAGNKISIAAPKGVTLFQGKNAAKRYVERVASNNKEKRMLRSRLKRRQAELAAQAVAA